MLELHLKILWDEMDGGMRWMNKFIFYLFIFWGLINSKTDINLISKINKKEKKLHHGGSNLRRIWDIFGFFAILIHIKIWDDRLWLMLTNLLLTPSVLFPFKIYVW